MSSKVSAATVVAGDTRNAVAAFDDALLSQTLLFASAIQAAKAINLPIGETQKLWSAFHRGAGGVIDGRQAVQDSISQMRAIAKREGLEEVMVGCLGGFPVGANDQPAETMRVRQSA